MSVTDTASEAFDAAHRQLDRAGSTNVHVKHFAFVRGLIGIGYSILAVAAELRYWRLHQEDADSFRRDVTVTAQERPGG